MRRTESVKGWGMLLSTAGSARVKGRGRNPFRSFSWLEAHDPSSIDDILGTALAGRDRKAQLAVVGTLLAVGDALVEKAEASSKRTPSPGGPALSPSAQTGEATGARFEGSGHSSLAPETRKTGAAELSSIRVLATTNHGEKRPMIEEIEPQRSEKADHPRSKLFAADTGPFGERVPMSTRGTAAGVPPGLRSLVVSLAERFVPVLVRIAGGDSARDDAAHERSRTSGGAKHAGASNDSAAPAPTTLAGFAAEASLVLVQVCALVASGGPGSAEVPDTAREERDLGETKRGTTGGAWQMERREALEVISALSSWSIPTLLSLAESWIGGGSLSGGELAASCYGTVSPADSQYEEAQHGVELGIMASGGRPPGSWAAQGNGDRTSLAALSVRDLRDLVSATEAKGRHLREFEAARRRARERDGLEELQSESDSATRTGPSATASGLSDDESLMEYASWHLAETIPTMVESSLWPTGGLRGGVGGGKRGGAAGQRRGGAARLAAVQGAMEEIHAFDRRALEMAGMEPPPGVDEGMWVAVRKLCVGLGGLKPKDLRPRDEGSAADELAARSSDAKDASRHWAGGGNAGDVISSTQESLMRVLSCPKPEVQRLGGAALGWVMSRALEEEGKHAGDSGDGEPAGAGGRAPTQAGDLSGLLMMLGEGDSAAAAAAEVLKGLARVRPLEIVPQLIRASRDSTTDGVESSRSSRLHLTEILAGVLRGVYRELRATASGGVLVENIGNHLIERLGSGEVEVRTAARKGLVSMDPGWITPRLCEWLSTNYPQRSEDKSGRKRTAVRPSGAGSASASGSASGTDQSGRAMIGGAGWQSQGRSAALQALGDLLVQGHDPPYALSALLDSLRISSPLVTNAPVITRDLAAVGPARAAAIAAKGVAHGVLAEERRGHGVRAGASGERADSGSAGRDRVHDTGDPDDSGSSRLKDQVLSSLPLWARRIRERSRALSLSYRVGESATCEPRSNEPSSTALANDALSSTRIPGEDESLCGGRHSTGERTLTSDNLRTEGRDEPAGILPRSRSPPAVSKPAQVASRASKRRPNLFGDCLEAVAIKTLAAPEDALPVRFFAILAAATAAATEATAGDETAAGSVQAGREVRGSPSSETDTPRSEGILRGVVDLICKRMSRQERLTDALLQDESEAATDKVRKMLFARLAPLLLLKALPARVLAAEDGQAGVHEAMSGSGDNCTRRPYPAEGSPGVKQENSSGVTAFAEDLTHEPGGGGIESSTGVEARVSSGGRVDPKEGLDAVGEIDPYGDVGAQMDELYKLLWERISRVYEYDQVTKLAAEVCGKLPARVVFPATISRLVAFVEAEERAHGISSGAHAPDASGGRGDGAEEAPGGDDEVSAAATTLAARGIFTICHAVSNHGELMEAWLAPTLSAIVRVLLLPAAESGDLARVQQGGIDCLAVLLETSASVAQDRQREGRGGHPDGVSDRPLVVEVNHGSISRAGKNDCTRESDVPASNGGDCVPGGSFSADQESSNREDGMMSLDEMPVILGAIVVEGVIPTGVLGSSYLAASEVPKTEPRGEKAAGDESGSDNGRIRNGDCGGRNTPAPMQVRICAANAAVLATRRCPEELLPTLCHHGNLLRNFLRGASRGSGSLRAACLQVVFALVYRSPGVFSRGWRADAGIGSSQPPGASSRQPFGYDNVMQIACDALDEGQGEEEVRLSGLKLILAVIAAGASSSEVAETNAASNASVSSGKGPPGLRGPSSTQGGDSVVVPGITVIGDGALVRPGDQGGGAGGQIIISPGVMSRAKRLLRGAANMDTSSDARELAGRALEAIGGIA